MVSLKNRSKGFTIVELLIVIVVIAILATLVIVTFTGIQQKARNSQRQTDINAIASHLEAFYAEKAYYPSLADLQDPAYISANLKGLDVKALADPKVESSGIPAGKTGIEATINTANSYMYETTGCTNTAATDATNQCASFAVTAQLEGTTDTYSKKSNT